ncbi:Uu.00g091500.m01.CDS01 [Anthostomella pinea]|uniref:DNA polymerase n=1 Tax=Anthostomella pinea TaxID=933095 RepID=A0AAI8YHZ3_9PEZI|nr:Uu.00g091500.m01.CDS01 [Anthostomella pinea]
MALDFPTIYLLPTHLGADELPELESQIPSLTYDINEAKVVLGKLSRRERAMLELRSRKLQTEEIVAAPVPEPNTVPISASAPPAKRRKLLISPRTSPGAGSSTASDTDEETGDTTSKARRPKPAVTPESPDFEHDKDVINVVRLAWFTDSMARGSVLPLNEYLIYRGRKKQAKQAMVVPSRLDPSEILRRARDDANANGRPASQHGSSQGYTGSQDHPRTAPHSKRPHLLKETTSEHDRAERLPPLPEYLHKPYACQRPAPFNPPNNAFIEQLTEMRTIRKLEHDDVGVRAYSTSTASIAAYPYRISHVAEIARLPGCGQKIVELYLQWKENGYLNDVEQAAASPKMRVLKLFYEIWGVGETTANEFYNRGWRDLDDIVEHGWDKLTRVQQIGVKYYDELLEKIPRAEVESIADIILQHANRIRDGYQMVIVGGYRRGKTASGDVDVVISHPDASATDFFINDIANSLEEDGHITHTLTISSRNSERGQEPVAWKGEGGKGSGFDTLDKALVVWQDPVFDKASSSKNPNPHRRVDIIISPWRTAGCAVIGWTGGTTLERDLRRYCKHVKRWKFDSSGVRTRMDGGDWVDIESDADGKPAPDMLTAEKRAFERLGLEWRPPTERCTG